jgi:hypothetical protein
MQRTGLVFGRCGVEVPVWSYLPLCARATHDPRQVSPRPYVQM